MLEKLVVDAIDAIVDELNELKKEIKGLTEKLEEQKQWEQEI